MLEIPDEIAHAVFVGTMPFAIFADWLDDHDWPAAARGFRMLDSKAVEMRHLRVEVAKPDGPAWLPYTLHRFPHQIGRLCESVAWSDFPLNEHLVKEMLSKFETAIPYRKRQKCTVCNRTRNLNLVRVCKACINSLRTQDNVRIPDAFTVMSLQRERDEKQRFERLRRKTSCNSLFGTDRIVERERPKDPICAQRELGKRDATGSIPGDDLCP
jgi:hypothetical protein